MNTQNVTEYIMLVTVVGLILWDIYAVWKAGGKATISYIMATLGTKSRLVPLAWGLLTGHFFWQIESLCK